VLREDGVVRKQNVVLYDEILNQLQMQDKNKQTDDNNNVTPIAVSHQHPLGRLFKQPQRPMQKKPQTQADR
jgi:hypothetical protein